jgi:hypothetical protein
MPNSSPELTEVERLRKLMKRATPLPWAWEQCGEKEDAPVVGVIVDGNNQPLTGCVECYNEDGSERGYYRETIAYDWQHCDGHSASANADFVVGAVNALPKLLDLIEALSSKNELPSSVMGMEEMVERACRGFEAKAKAIFAAKCEIEERNPGIDEMSEEHRAAFYESMAAALDASGLLSTPLVTGRE